MTAQKNQRAAHEAALWRNTKGQCHKCGTVSVLRQYYGLDLSVNPAGKNELLQGDFFRWRCPHCGFETFIGYPCWYFDPEERLEIVHIPDLATGQEKDALAHMNQNLEGLAAPGFTRRAAGTFFAMQEIVRIQAAGLDGRAVQLAKPLIIGELQSRGEVVWNGFFRGAAAVGPDLQEPVQNVLYAAVGPDKEAAYGQTIYWYDIHLTDGEVITSGVNETLFQMCQNMLAQSNPPEDDGRFQLYDLNWAIAFHDRLQKS